jgi:hypothetical protein
MGRTKNLSHLLFVDDILIFCSCAKPYGKCLKDILETLCEATGMVINIEKLVIYLPGAQEQFG